MSRRNYKIGAAAAVAAMLIFAGSAFAAQTHTATIRPALPAPGEAPAGSPVARHGRLRVLDGNIVGEDNQPVILRGVSFFHSASLDGGAWYTDEVVAWMAHDWKASVVRPAMSFDSTQCAHNGTFGGAGNPGWAHPQGKGNWDLAKRVIEAAIRRGMYVVLDLHSYRAHNYTESAAEFFQQVVDEFGAYPNILYEIYNEPNPHDQNRGQCPPGISAGGGGIWSPTVLNYSNTVINAIRTREQQLGYANNIIIIGNPEYSAQPNVTPAPTNTTNTSWTIHFYADSHQPIDNGSGSWRPFGNMVAAHNMGRSLFATEFSHCNSSGSVPVNIPNTVAWINALEQRNIGWITWSVTNKACRGGTFQNNQCVSTPPGYPCGGNGQPTCEREAASLFAPSVTAASAANWTDANPPTLNDASQGGAAMLRDSIRSKNSNYFTATSWPVTVNASPAEGGTVTGGGTGLAYGAEVNLTAVPAEGWEFSHWSGDASGSNPSIPTTRIRGTSLNAVANFWRSNAVRNGHFTLNTLLPHPATTQAWTFGTGGSGAGNINVVDGELRVNVTNPGANLTDARVQQTGINLNANTRYRLTFRARADSPRNILVTLFRTGRDPDMSQGFSLSGEMSEYTVEFDVNTAISNVALRFNMGGNAVGANVAWFLDDVRIDDIGPATGADLVCTGSCTDNVTTSIRHATNRNGTAQLRTTLRGRQLNISGVSGSRVDVAIYDMTGRVRMSRSVEAMGDRAVMSLDRLPAGVYSVQVKVDGRMVGRGAERVVVR